MPSQLPACPHPHLPPATGGQLVRGQAPRPRSLSRLALDLGIPPWGAAGPEALWAGAWPRLAQSQGRLQRERRQTPFCLQPQLLLEGPRGQSQVGPREPAGCLDGPTGVGRTGTHRCGGREPAEGLEPARSPAVVPPLPPSSCPCLAREVTSSRKPAGCGFPSRLPTGLRALRVPVMGELPVRLDSRGRPGSDVLLWSSVARLCHRPSTLSWETGGFMPVSNHRPLTGPHLSASPAPGSLAASLHPRHAVSSRPRASRSSPSAAVETPCGLRAGPLLGALLPWPPVRHLQTCQRPGHHYPILTPSALPGFNSLQGHFLLAPSLLMCSQLSAYSDYYCPGHKDAEIGTSLAILLAQGSVLCHSVGQCPRSPGPAATVPDTRPQPVRNGRACWANPAVRSLESLNLGLLTN